LEAGLADGVIDAASTVWDPGTAVWDFVAPLVEAAGLRLWCDGARRWPLDRPLEAGRSATVATDANLPEDNHVLDAEEDFADGVVIRYTWTDSNGDTHTAWDVAGKVKGRRAIRLDRDRPPPAVGAAQYVLD